MELELKDNLSIDLNYLTTRNVEGLFKFEPMGIMPYEKNDSVWISVTVERSLTMLYYERTVYTTFDFLSDVGGLSGILISGLWIFVHFWNFNSFDNFMAVNLFKMKKPEDNQSSRKKKHERIVLANYPNCKDLMVSLVPRCCSHLCKRSRKERVLETARSYLKKELNIF